MIRTSMYLEDNFVQALVESKDNIAAGVNTGYI